MRLLSVLLLGVSLGLTAEAETWWRLSNSLGKDLGPAKASSQGWLLKIERNGSAEERTLLNSGKTDTVWLVDLDSVQRPLRSRVVRDGVPLWEYTFDPVTGWPVSETTFDDGQIDEITELEMTDRRLSGRTVRGPDGTLRYRDRLFVWPDGTLRRLERDDATGPLAEVSWRYGPGRTLAEVWIVDSDARARGEHREVLIGGGKIEDRVANDTMVLVTRIKEVLESGTREVRTDQTERKETRVSDARGRLLEEQITMKGVVTEVRRWTYDAQGRLLESVSEVGGVREVWAYTYGDDFSEAQLTRDGLLVRRERNRDGEKVLVSYFDRGSLFLQETWDQGRKVKESYFQNGVLAREREF